MGLKIYGNTKEDAAASAEGFEPSSILKVVSVKDHVNAYQSARGCYMVIDSDGAVIYISGRPVRVMKSHLYLYSVVAMPAGFKLTLEQV